MVQHFVKHFKSNSKRKEDKRDAVYYAIIIVIITLVIDKVIISSLMWMPVYSTRSSHRIILHWMANLYAWNGRNVFHIVIISFDFRHQLHFRHFSHIQLISIGYVRLPRVLFFYFNFRSIFCSITHSEFKKSILISRLVN